MKYNYKKRVSYLIYFVYEMITLVKIMVQTKSSQTPVKFHLWFMQRIVGINRKAYWPTHFTSNIGNVENI